MIAAVTYDIKGIEEKATALPAGVFGVKVSPKLLAQAVRVFLGNQRSASAKTLTRSDINRTKSKWFKQKGTGRARHGSRSAPIFVGGGVSHGPDGKQTFALEMPTKMKRLALLGALSAKASAKQVIIISGTDKVSGKTSEVAPVFGKIAAKRGLVVTGDKSDKFTQASKNIGGVDITLMTGLNTYSVMACDKLILSEGALAHMVKTYAK